MKRQQHRKTNTRLYRIWQQMKNRCSNLNFHAYHKYGGSGIDFPKKWEKDFMAFYTWAMNNGYHETLSLDRTNPFLSYSEENCRWTTRTVQSRNTRPSIHNSSRYTGVNFHKIRKKYQVKIRVNYKQVYLGLYETDTEGAIVRNQYIVDNNLEHTLAAI